jgi:hypothetical protein
MKRSSPLAYAFFFVVTLIGVGALFFFCRELHLPKGWITAVLALATAEWLIRRHGFESTGVESALWLGGLFAFIAGLPSTGKPESILVFAAAAAIAGWRVRNPWFGALAVVLVLFYLREKNVSAQMLAAAAQGIAIGAALLRGRTWRLASTDRLFGAIAIAAPLPAIDFWSERLALDIGGIYLLGGAIVLGIALRLRDRMLLIAGAISVVMAALDLHKLFDYRVEGKLVAAGVALVAISLLVSRALRGRTRGIVVTPAAEGKYQEAVTLAATVFAQPQHAPASDSGRFEGGGGDAGGGGATDSF